MIVTNETDFRTALARGSWAIVITGIADAQKFRDLKLIAASAALLPVVDNPTSAQIKQIKKSFPVALKATTPKCEPLLDVIFNALHHNNRCACVSR